MKKFPPKTILVAYDFTKRSLQAWRYAQALAKRTRARLHAVYISPWTIGPDGAMLPMRLSAGERAAVLSRLRGELGEDASVHLGEGDIVTGTLRAAKRLNADLIVMATAGRTGMRRFLLGSMTEALVRVSPVPVLVVHGPAELPAKVLAPVNLEAYSLAGLARARLVAAALRGSLTALHVAQGTLSTADLRRLELAAEQAGASLRVSDGAPVRKIIEEAGRHDLVVLVAHRRGLWRDGVLGTTAEQVLRQSTTPVLTVPLAPEPEKRRRMVSRAGREAARRRLSAMPIL